MHPSIKKLLEEGKIFLSSYDFEEALEELRDSKIGFEIGPRQFHFDGSDSFPVYLFHADTEAMDELVVEQSREKAEAEIQTALTEIATQFHNRCGKKLRGVVVSFSHVESDADQEINEIPSNIQIKIGPKYNTQVKE